MKTKLKVFLTGFLTCAILLSIFTAVFGADVVEKYTAYKNKYPIYLDGKEVQSIGAVKIGDYNYIKAADVSKLFKNTTISFNETKSVIEVRQNDYVPTRIPDTNMPVLKLGETYSFNGVEITLEKIDYRKFTNLYGKCPVISATIKNNSKKILLNSGFLNYRIKETDYQDELNNRGGSYISVSSYIYPGESISGEFVLYFSRDITVQEVMYTPSIKDETITSPVAKWTIE